ncbi:MAG: helix-turn-helix domain-containing protein [Clostridia bacterium]|nr:helix-turn-helix domain-containing protein [Clostridia bacterium]
MVNKFAQRLSELLETSGLSKRAFAQQINVSAMSVSDWTTGKVQPIAENIYLVAKYFKVSSDYLLGLEDELGVKNY